MQKTASEAVRQLLTAQQVQRMLEIDRSTVYRMAEDGRLPAIKVGRQWRFPADHIAALLDPNRAAGALGAAPGAPPKPALAPQARPLPQFGADAAAGLQFGAEALSVLQISAELLEVMMIVTDMNGQPLSPVVNPCDWFVEQADDPEIVRACLAEWQSMADDPDCMPRFHTGVLGFQCARAFVRSGTALVGMVMAGGIAPPASAAPGLYQLDDGERRRVLRSLPRVAAALSHVSPRHAGPTDRRSRS